MKQLLVINSEGLAIQQQVTMLDQLQDQQLIQADNLPKLKQQME